MFFSGIINLCGVVIDKISKGNYGEMRQIFSKGSILYIRKDDFVFLFVEYILVLQDSVSLLAFLELLPLKLKLLSLSPNC